MTTPEFDFNNHTDTGTKAGGELKFETALERLETVLAEMEDGSLSLDDSMKYFEEGMKLANFCTARLADTEKKVEILLKRNSAASEWAPLPENTGEDC